MIRNSIVLVLNCRVPRRRLLAVSRRPRGFRELREACRIHFHLSWYLSDSKVPTYGPKPRGNLVFRLRSDQSLTEPTDKVTRSGPRVPGDLISSLVVFGFLLVVETLATIFFVLVSRFLL